MADVSQRFNHEVYNIAVSLIRKFDERVSSIPDILKLTLGEPDFNTPEHVKKSGVRTKFQPLFWNGRLSRCSASSQPLFEK